MTTIHGVLGDHLWVERDGDVIAFTPADLRQMGRDLRSDASMGSVRVAGFDWDESQFKALGRGFLEAPELDSCRDCAEFPVLDRLDSRCVSCGIAHDEASDRISAIGRA